ncbi:uracil-DNA glycosylase [Ramlibacter tataouinensis]|uniref:uracil-DNA glycosylase n=1 Tax=Ramlibacter tataouinensis TaxID=94132 RepID=UPI0022F390C0|nr:uracil-DNA glycosylase [Ramlibacter tataouinensis]WBY00527.1 uracil-DNA glycosylase [Ramlibacter tataouinensis]
MNAATFVRELGSLTMPSVFNPYHDTCLVYDRSDAPAVRRKNLRSILSAALALEVDTIWMGRDLGYRGGRRTGLALTDERHLSAMPRAYPGAVVQRSTHGPEVTERTAAEIWAVLMQLDRPPLLWNVFPFHPHEEQDPFTNRKFTRAELDQVDQLNAALIDWLGVCHIVAIGQDAAGYAKKFGVKVSCVRHPSYGGIADFRRGISELYGIPITSPASSAAQRALF